jgi:flagellar biosynthesis protein FlhF
MNIRRFVAPDMREGLRAIRSTLGEDAVMLSSRRVAEGVEIIAAMDYDDRLFAATGDAELDRDAAAEEDLGAPDAEPASDPRRDSLFGARGFEQRAAAYGDLATDAWHEPAAASTTAGQSSLEVQEELKDLRRLLESQLASFAWNDVNRRKPARARMLRDMTKFGVDPDLVRTLMEQIPKADNSREGLRALVRLFGERLPLVQGDLTDRGGVFAVVGPTGVGKTTSIAKIAARFILRHSADELGLVSTDTYRIGARQQLLTFARILGVPMQVADGASELRRVLDGLGRKKLVLIDTAGMSQRDVRLANQLAALEVEEHRVQAVLALSAAADPGCLAEAFRAFEAADPQYLLVTKLDEAIRLGPVLSLAIQHELPVAYVSDGQRVPEDLHIAAPKRFWLVQQAVRLARDCAIEPEEAELADCFGTMELTAHA